MSEDLSISKGLDKKERYAELIPQIEALVTGEPDMIANMANIAAALKETFNFWWVGFYQVKENQLVLGPFQGPVACTRIPFEKGVCGACYTQKKTMLVEDVDQFPGHIACSSATKSEIVIPVWNQSKTEVIAVLDVDSDKLNDFDLDDQQALERIAGFIS